MALQQPQSFQKAVRVGCDQPASPSPLPPQVRSGPDESQTWVLFSPATEYDTASENDDLGSAQEQTQHTAGHSRAVTWEASDLGSLETVGRRSSKLAASDLIEDAVADDDDLELDSLDGHLHEFHTAVNAESQDGVLLPSHDGLGTFQPPSLGASAAFQQQLYALEKFSRHRAKRPREGFDLSHLELESEQMAVYERTRRIEAWRLEQSKILLEQIQNETRRRRLSQASGLNQGRPVLYRTNDNVDTAVAADSPLGGPVSDSDWYEPDASAGKWNMEENSFFSWITDRVIHDLMGIDEKLLAILFGEALPDEQDLKPVKAPSSLSTKPSSTPPLIVLPESDSSVADSTWQLHILDRLAHELGLLINHLSQHPGAFSAYARMLEMPISYAGLPAIPESANDMEDKHPVSDAGEEAAKSEAAVPEFRPTISAIQPHIGVSTELAANAGGAEGLIASEADAPTARAAKMTDDAFTQQEWEQDLDITLVFRYFRSRFGGHRHSSSASTAATASASLTNPRSPCSPQEAAAKAARVRQHHPLISSHTHAPPSHRSRPTPLDRRGFKAITMSVPGPGLRRAGSYGSQGTRRSARRSNVSSRHSSRNYWDIGGSGSLITSTGPLGSWGDI